MRETGGGGERDRWRGRERQVEGVRETGGGGERDRWEKSRLASVVACTKRCHMQCDTDAK